MSEVGAPSVRSQEGGSRTRVVASDVPELEPPPASVDTAQQIGGDIPVRIVLVEDEPLFCELLCIALNQNTHLEIVGSFADGAAALKAVPQLRPNVALLDIELKGDINGVQLGLRLRNALPALGIVLLSNHAEPQFLAAVRREALVGWSYLLKRSVGDVATLGRAIEGAASGLVVLDPLLVAQLRSGPTGHLARLTPRQREILELMAQGYSNTAIAERLVLARKSVENGINGLYRELGIDPEDQLVHPRARAVQTFLLGRPAT